MNRNALPEWLTSSPSTSGNLGVVLSGMTGTVIALCALNVADQAFLQTTVKNLAENRQQPKPKPVAEITRSGQAPRNDWNKIVEEQARRGAMSQQQPEQPTGSDSPTFKQTVFSDQNYTPRGADNVLSLRETYQPAEPEKPAGTARVTVIKETKDQTCWPLKEGSIERRNCKSYAGLNSRE